MGHASASQAVIGDQTLCWNSEFEVKFDRILLHIWLRSDIQHWIGSLAVIVSPAGLYLLHDAA